MKAAYADREELTVFRIKPSVAGSMCNSSPILASEWMARPKTGQRSRDQKREKGKKIVNILLTLGPGIRHFIFNSVQPG